MRSLLMTVTALAAMAAAAHAQAGQPSAHATAAPPTASQSPAAATRHAPALQPGVAPVPAGRSNRLHTPQHHLRRWSSGAELRVRMANHIATREPITQGFVNAIQVYPYSDGVLYQLLAAPERVTDIALQPGEAIVSVAAGDTVRWTVGDTTSGAGEAKQVHVLVKPFAAGLSTNLILTTDRRTYHLQLDSTGATAMAALSWTYPADALLAIKRQQADSDAQTPVAPALAIGNLNFGYAITGDSPAWRPVRAFDDGRQTFIEFPGSISVGEAPPLFVIGDKGDAELVNYRVAGHFYVVDRLFSAAELRLGAKKQSIVRISRTTDRGRRLHEGRGA